MANTNLRGMVWRLSIPIILVEATETFDHLIDTLFLARVGVTELGAIAVADTVMLLFLILPLSLVDSIQILTARRAGQRRKEALGATFNQGLLLVVCLSLVSLLALKFFSPVVANWIVGSQPVGDAVDGYLQLDALSIPLVGITFACSALLTSLGRTRVLVPATIILVLADVAINYVFIFGKFGFPELGMRGAAMGSIGAELAAAVFLCSYVIRALRPEGYGFFRFRPFDRRTIRALRDLSLPMAAQGFVQDLRWFGFFLIIERMGTESLAIANIAFTCYLVFSIPSEGFAETVCSMVSRYIGRNRGDRIEAVLRSATWSATLATLPLVVIASVAPQWVLAVFAPGENVVAQSHAILRVVALGMLVAIPAEMWFTAVLGTGDTLAALGIDLLLTLIMLGIAYFAAVVCSWPIEAVWLAGPIAWLVCLAASYGWMRSGVWKRLAV